MADPASITMLVGGLFFSGMTAAANISSAISAHNSNKRRNEDGSTGDNANNGSHHLQGSNMTMRLEDSNGPGPAPNGNFYQIVTHGGPSGYGQTIRPHGPNSSLPRRLEGWVTLEKEQQTPDTTNDTKIGIHTGRMRGYNQEMADKHWLQFQEGVFKVPRTIAVVNWSERIITMYEYNLSWRIYFRNYQVLLLDADLDAFARLYHGKQVFSGIVEGTWLTFHNSYLREAPKHWWDKIRSVKSSNSWSLLGIEGDIRGPPVFMEVKRAAVIGLIESRYKDPTLLNVDMVGHKGAQAVKVDTMYHSEDLVTRGNTVCFSVFSFSDRGWSEEMVRVG